MDPPGLLHDPCEFWLIYWIQSIIGMCTLLRLRFNDSHNLQMRIRAQFTIGLHPCMNCSRILDSLNARLHTCQNTPPQWNGWSGYWYDCVNGFPVVCCGCWPKGDCCLSKADPCVGWDPNGDCCLVAADPTPGHACWAPGCPKPGGGCTFVGCIPGG